MKNKKLINLLEKHNLDAEIIINEKIVERVTVSSKAECKCKEKEIYLNIK